MASEELGAAAYRKFDIEAWFPSRNEYAEVTSTSNCTNYQAKRLNVQYIAEENRKKVAHTVNGTAVAVPRIIMAILENFQRADGSVRIPDALQNYLGGMQVLERK